MTEKPRSLIRCHKPLLQFRGRGELSLREEVEQLPDGLGHGVRQSADSANGPHVESGEEEARRTGQYLQDRAVNRGLAEEASNFGGELAWKSFPRVSCAINPILAMSPPLSLIPATFGWSARSAATSGGRSTPVLAGTLYSTIGTGLASATAS